MKRLLLALALMTISAICYAQPQYPINQTIGAPTTLVTSRGGFKADSSLIVPYYSDTAKANISPYGKNYAGAVIRVGDSLYMRNASATKWINLSQSGGGGGGNSWLVGGNTDAIPPYIGNIDQRELDFITFNAVRMRIPSGGILRGSAGAKKYLLLDTTTKYLYYGDGGTATADTPTLQMVLNKGNLSYQKSVLIIDSVNTGASANTVAVLSSADSIRGSTSPYFVGLEKRFTTNYATLEFDKTTYTNKLLPILKLSSSDLDKEFRATSEKLFFKKLSGGGTTFYVQPPNTLTNNTLTLPNTTGTLIAKINGNSPDSTGNITISTGSGTVTSVATGYGLSGGTITTTGTLIVDTSASGLSGKYVRISDSSSMLSPYLRKIDTTNKWVNNITRTLGKDSIIYYIGSTRYAIKDSVGNTSGFVPYTGATQDVNLLPHNIIVNNVDARTTTLTTSNQTIQLTLDSSFIQLATGTTSNIYYNLPNATTLFVGASFQFNNNTTSGAISVRNFGVVNTIATIPSGGAVQVVLLSNTTTTGTWDVLNYGPKNTSWGTDSLNATNTKAKFSSLVLGTPLTVSNGGADSTTYYTKYRSDTSRTNIYTAIGTKLNISDTASMLSPYLLNVPRVAYLGSDFTTSSTTAVNTNLSIAVAANTAYRIMISGSASKATSSTGMKISIGAPTGTTIKATASLGSNAISTIVNSFITSINSLGSTFATGVGVEVPFRVEGILVTGANAGTITLQGATVTSNTATIYASTLMTISTAYSQ